MAILRLSVALFGFVAVRGDPSVTVKLRGTYRIQQKSNMLYLDAYDSANDGYGDYMAVMNPLQSNPSQWWYVESTGGLDDQNYYIRQVGKNDGSVSGRFLDADEASWQDYEVLTRTAQANPSQEWHFVATADENTFTIQQVGRNDGTNWSPARYLDAYQGEGTENNGYMVVTRESQGDATQEWVLTPLLPGDEVLAEQLIASLAQPRSMWMVAPLPLCIVAGTSMAAVVIGLMRRRDRSLPADGFAPLVNHEDETA